MDASMCLFGKMMKMMSYWCHIDTILTFNIYHLLEINVAHLHWFDLLCEIIASALGLTSLPLTTNQSIFTQGTGQDNEVNHGESK